MHSEDQPPRAPRWVWISAVVVGVLAVVAVALLLFGGQHGPGRHLSVGEAPPRTAVAPAGVGR
jgi:hypothetical protein